MSNSVGQNAGVSGLLDIPGTGALLKGVMVGFGQKLAVTTKPRRGRGGAKWAKARAVVASGSIAVVGAVVLSDPPLPSKFEGQEGTLTLQAGFAKDQAQTESMPVRVTGAEFKLNEKSGDTWDFVVTCEITAPPTWAGFATAQGTATDPTKTDQEQWGEGTSKTLDPSGLLTAATRLTDVWGDLPDNDGGEADRLATLVAAAMPPIDGLKLRTAVFQRDSDDGGVVVETWGLTSSADDQTLPVTFTDLDPTGLQSTADVAAINDVPEAPDSFAAQLVSTTSRRLNDGNEITIAHYGTRTNKQAIEFDGTFLKLDASDLESVGQETRVYNGAAPAANIPAGLQLIASSTTTINPDNDKVQYFYAKDTPQQKAEQEASFQYVDPDGIESEGAVAAMDATPSVPAGFVEVGTRTKNLTNDHALNVVVYGLLSPKEKIEHRGTGATEDSTGGTTTEDVAVSDVLSTDTAADLAAAALTAVATDATVGKVVVRKENKTRAVTTVVRINDDLTLRASVRTRQEKVLGTPSGGDWSATPVSAVVRVARVPTVGADNTVGLIQHQSIERTRGQFVLRRRAVVTSSIGALLQDGLIGTVNDDIFLDQDPHTLKYSGYDVVEDYKRRDGSHVVVIEYYFDKDSLFHQNETNLAYGWVPTQTPSTYITDPGFYVSTAVFATDMEISFPDEEDFSGFAT